MRLTHRRRVDEAEDGGDDQVGGGHEHQALGGIGRGRRGGEGAGGAGEEGAPGEGAEAGEIGEGERRGAGVDDDGPALLAGVAGGRVVQLGEARGAAAAGAVRGMQAIGGAVGAEGDGGRPRHADHRAAALHVDGEDGVGVDDDEQPPGLRRGERRGCDKGDLAERTWRW